MAFPIEERDADEVRWVQGLDDPAPCATCASARRAHPARNWALMTPARLVTRLLCERGVCEASEAGIPALFPEYR